MEVKGGKPGDCAGLKLKNPLQQLKRLECWVNMHIEREFDEKSFTVLDCYQADLELRLKPSSIFIKLLVNPYITSHYSQAAP